MNQAHEKFFDFRKKCDKSVNNENTLASYICSIDSVKPNAILRNYQFTGSDYFIWCKPSEQFSALAIGSVYQIRENGKDRINETEKKILELKNKIFNNWNESEFKSFPFFVGGMKFSPADSGELWNDYADSDWYVPKYLYLSQNERSYFIYNFNLRDDEATIMDGFDKALKILEGTNFESKKELLDDFKLENSTDDVSEYIIWKEKITAALEKINSGTYQKIVLSRMVKHKINGRIPVTYALDRLAENYPRCYIFAFAKSDSVFFGASPEMLAKISAGYIETDALAGSIPRGGTESEDKILERELLTSKKNLKEQKTVVDFIVNAFSSFSDEVEYSEQPVIRKLSNIQHLWTPIRAKLKHEEEVFSILKAIHPTPAICGAPWTAALDSIIEMEEHSRGLFTGSIGWFNFNGEGEFAVAIRSALLKSDELYAFAGCGIVDGSDPELEFREAELKLKPILSLFENEKTEQPK